jgi:AraC-like DNA-binding protein
VDLDVVGVRMPRVQAAWAGRGTLCSPQGREVAPLLRRLVSEVSEDRALRHEALAAAVDLLVVEATRVLLPGPGTAHTLHHPVVLRARRLLDEEYAAAWTVGSLAEACGTSRTRLARLFAEEVGQPPYRYLLERRVERACELLATTPYPVTEVAAAVGFGSHVQLARRFRQLRGMSPTQWRAAETGRP